MIPTTLREPIAPLHPIFSVTSASLAWEQQRQAAAGTETVESRLRAAAYNNLAEFVRQGWETMEPGTPLLWNWHTDAICAHLEAVTDGHIRRLLINVPPGHM